MERSGLAADRNRGSEPHHRSGVRPRHSVAHTGGGQEASRGTAQRGEREGRGERGGRGGRGGREGREEITNTGTRKMRNLGFRCTNVPHVPHVPTRLGAM